MTTVHQLNSPAHFGGEQSLAATALFILICNCLVCSSTFR